MRTVDPSDLRPMVGGMSPDHERSLEDGGRGPWRLGNDRIVKTYHPSRRLDTEEAAGNLFDLYRVAFDSVAGTPEPFEVVRVGDEPETFGVVVEYVRGVALTLHVLFGSISTEEAGRELGKLLRRLHGARARVGRDYRELFREWMRTLAPLLAPYMSQVLPEKLVDLVDAIPETDTLLHGDAHMANVVVMRDGFSFIDMDLAGFGHPVFDLAISRSRDLLDFLHKRMPGMPDPRAALGDDLLVLAQGSWDETIAGYVGDDGPVDAAELDRRVSVLAEVEHCCWRFGMRDMGDEGLTDGCRSRLEIASKRLETLLPQVSRLDF